MKLEFVSRYFNSLFHHRINYCCFKSPGQRYCGRYFIESGGVKMNNLTLKYRHKPEVDVTLVILHRGSDEEGCTDRVLQRRAALLQAWFLQRPSINQQLYNAHRSAMVHSFLGGNIYQNTESDQCIDFNHTELMKYRVQSWKRKWWNMFQSGLC